MQPLARLVPRLTTRSISSSPTSAFLRFSDRPSIRVCIKCKIQRQIRHYAEDSKPTSVSSSKLEKKPVAPTPTSDETPTEELPSAEEGRRLAVTKRFSNIMDHLQGNIFLASQRINDLTGYSGIEALKSRISKLEQAVLTAQENVRTSRDSYKTTVAERAATQREVTGLLARKDTWSPADLERFTSLYRMDHSNEQAVQQAVTRLADAEREAEHAASKLSSSILSRYHEEQIWSDKIRRMSTWGTWGLMGVNILLFFVFQFGFEPWRRARLVSGFEEKVREALEKEKISQGRLHVVDQTSVDGIVAASAEELQLEAGDKTQASQPVVDALVAVIGEEVDQQKADASLDAADLHAPSPAAPVLDIRDIYTWEAYFKDLFSERTVAFQKRDVTVAVLEGVATGAALVTIIATLILRNS